MANQPHNGSLTRQQARRDDPYAFPLDTPDDLTRRRFRIGEGGNQQAAQQPAQSPAQQPDAADAADKSTPRQAATESIARRAGALSDEINFPAFVASLLHGTYDAVVDASIRQMEAYADLVSAVAKDADQFTAENVTRNQVLDWLSHQYPRDLTLDVPVGPNAAEPALHVRQKPGSDEEPVSPAWLADFGLAGQELTDDFIEEQLIPVARRKVGENRLQMLATMVLLGMNRINVKDGSISAKVRFRAAASDKGEVSYAVGQDPGGPNWAERGSATYEQHTTMVSTVGANVQTDSELRAELFGEVRINFASETLPLDRFVDSARMAVLQRNVRPNPSTPNLAAPGAGSTTPAPFPEAAPSPAPAPAAQPATAPPAAAPPPQRGGK